MMTRLRPGLSGQYWRRLASLVSWLVVAGCRTPAPVPPPPAAEIAAPEPVVETAPRWESQPLKYLAGRHLAPMPVQPLNIKANCSFRDPTGYRGHLDLRVKAADVERFSAEVTVPKKGVCRFDLKDFRQTETLPTVVLSRPEDACVVRMWAQEGKVTVAFHECRQQCSGESFEHLWPILADARTGRCS